MTRRRQKPFAATGGASSFKAQIEKYSNGFCDLPGIEHMGQITPFQRQVLDAATAKEHQEKQKKQEEMRQQQGQGGPSRPTNSRSGGVGPNNGSDMGQHETVRYVNENEYPDHPVHDEEPDSL